MFRRTLVICFLTSIFFTNVAEAQEDKTDFQTWTDFTTYLFVSNRSAVGGDFGIRGLLSSKGWTQLYIRPTFRFQYNSLDLAGGVGLFQTYNKSVSNITEIRLFQQATLHWPTTHILKFNHRLRFEQRFFNYNDPNQGDSKEDFSSRLRYQLGIRTRDFTVFKQKIYFKTAVEFFQKNNSGNEVFINTSRLIATVGHRLKGKFWYELHYISQRSRQLEEDGSKTSEHILRLRLFRAAVFRHRIE